jgi:hypothetical protein
MAVIALVGKSLGRFDPNDEDELREDAGAYTTGTVGENRDASDRNLVSWQSSHW